MSGAIFSPALRPAHQLSAESADPFFHEIADPGQEPREFALEALRRLLVWMAEGPTLEERGVRATVALYCIRPDLIGDPTLERIGNLSGVPVRPSTSWRTNSA
jgi:hypothetical protein